MYKDITEVTELKLTDKLKTRAVQHKVMLEYNNGELQSGMMNGIQNINDSMELDSGQFVAWVEGRIEGLRFEAEVKVHGNVRVIFRDRIYKNAGRMPKELLQAYHDGTDPEEAAKADGQEYVTPYYCASNNWFEECLVIFDKDRKIVAESYDVIDSPVTDLSVLIEDIIEMYESKF